MQAAFLREKDFVIKICLYMTATPNAENLRENKIRFSLILEKILAFTSSSSMVLDVKNLSPNFKQTVWRCFTLLDILIWIIRSILSLNSKQNQQKLCSDSFYIVDITCHFLYLNQTLPIFSRHFSFVLVSYR